jgi:hypothetical protein
MAERRGWKGEREREVEIKKIEEIEGERGRKRDREGGREREKCFGVLDEQFRYSG